MAKFYTNFSEYTLGQTIGDIDWSQWFGEPNPDDAYTIIEHNSERAFEFDSSKSSGANHYVSWDKTGQSRDAEIYTDIYVEGGGFGNVGSLIVQAKEESSRDAGYLTDFRSDQFSLAKYEDGSRTTFANVDEVVDPISRRKIRIRREGDYLKGKHWDYTESEPSGWDIELSDDTIDFSQRHAIGNLNGRDFRIFEFGVGTNGDSAPTSITEAIDKPSSPTNLTTELI